MNGNMNFFTQPFDIRNNQAFVGFDADQSFIGGGFTLQWNAKRMYKYDFTDVFDAHTFVTEEAGFLFTKVQFNTERGSVHQKYFGIRTSDSYAKIDLNFTSFLAYE